jgi:hypothetical protein
MNITYCCYEQNGQRDNAALAISFQLQGDQIHRLLACWRLFTLGSFFKEIKWDE